MEFLLVLRWLLAFAAVAAVGAPLAALLFPDLPRRGAAFALPAALVPLAVATFWIGQVTFGPHAVAAGLLVVLAGSIVAYVRGGVPDWRAVAGAYGVFAVGFLLLVLFRGYTPGITPGGGEQFLHFGLVNALLRAESLPPHDFWFAGEPLRYYYGTQLQVATFTTLTGTPARHGFNLGIAVFYGLLVVVAYGLGGSVVAAHDRSYHLGGVLGAFFVAVGGALTTTVRLAFGLLPEDVALRYGGPAFGAVRHMDYPEAVAELSDPASWGWFFTRYVVTGTLQEFPLYSFVKADLHGHAHANGYVLFAAALAFSYYRTPADRRWRRLAIVFGGMGLVAGVFGFMNTWSLPTVVGLAWLAMAAGPHPATLFPDDLAGRLRLPRPEGREPAARLAAELWRLVLAGALAALVAVIGVVVASPFLVFGHVPTNDGLGLFPPRTDLAPFLVIYGGILALLAGFVGYRGWPATRRHSPRTRLGVALATVLAGAVLVAVLDFAVLAITGPILVGAWWLVRTDRAGFEAVLLVAGVGLILAMDVVYAKVWPPEWTRWNTTLKVAVQAWSLAAAAAGAAGALLLADARDALVAARARTADRASSIADGGRDAASIAGPVLAIALVVAVAVTSAPFAALTFSGVVLNDAADADVGPVAGFGALAGDLADGDGEPTLDGLAANERRHEAEMRAIHWLDDRPGLPTIVEAPGHETYQWTNPASTLTGLPTVVGWDHQRGYRGSAAFERRAAQADDVYTGSWSNAAAVLRTHEVDYVYVGSTERERYGESLRSFDRAALSVAFENEAVTIYAVDRSALPETTWTGNESGA